MRNVIVAVCFSLLVTGAAGKGSPSAKIAKLPSGNLADHVYTNDTVGVSAEFPGDWTVTADAKEPINLDQGHPNGAANRCSKTLLWLSAPQKEEGRFYAMATLVAIDPSCLTIVPFPKSLRDQQDLNDVEGVIIKNFKNSPFLPFDRVTILASDQQGQVVIQLTGDVIINAIAGNPAPKKEPLTVHTSFEVTETRDFWIAWAYVADALNADVLRRMKISFRNAQSSH